MLNFPCFLCRGGLEIRTDKNGKRYIVCNDCGVQAFIRRKPGIERLETLARDFKNNGGQLNGNFDACALSKEIQDLKREIKKLQRKGGGFFTGDAEIKRAIKALKTRLSTLLSTLEKHAKDAPFLYRAVKNIS